jgi:hypothetical protein
LNVFVRPILTTTTQATRGSESQLATERKVDGANIILHWKAQMLFSPHDFASDERYALWHDGIVRIIRERNDWQNDASDNF